MHGFRLDVIDPFKFVAMSSDAEPYKHRDFAPDLTHPPLPTVYHFSLLVLLSEATHIFNTGIISAQNEI